MDQIIDQSIAEYLEQLEKSQEEFVKDTEDLEKQGLGTEQILGILGALIIGLLISLCGALLIIILKLLAVCLTTWSCLVEFLKRSYSHLENYRKV